MLSSTRPTRRRALAATAGIATITLALTACGGGGTNEGDGGDDTIELHLSSFNNMGYSDELLAKYEAEHPGVTIVHDVFAKSEDARADMTTKLAGGGAGIADVAAIEVDWLPELMQYPDLFTDLTDPELEGRWVDWKTAQATTPDGKLIGYGTDIGPEAVCYRQDLFEAAGLASDPAAVAELLGGADATWDEYFAAGEQFVAASDSAWYDSATSINQAMVNQIDYAYENEDGTPKDLADNAEIKEIFDFVTAGSGKGLSAGLEQWSEDWDAGFQNDAFATMLCPAWMTGPVEERAGGVTGWNVADVFPGGGGNWGGSFLTVPASGENAEAAKELAAWLTAPEQQTAAFEEAGTFPSQIEAQSSEAVQSFTNAFFNDAPVGQIFSNRAQAIEGAPFKGRNYFSIHTEVTNAILRVDVQKTDDAAASWDKAVAAVEGLGLS